MQKNDFQPGLKSVCNDKLRETLKKNYKAYILETNSRKNPSFVFIEKHPIN